MNGDYAEFLITTIEHLGHREIRKHTMSKKEMKRYLKTIDPQRQPEVWGKIGGLNENKAQGKR